MATVFTDAGKAITTNRLIGSGSDPKYLAIGTGAGTALAAGTALFDEVESRVSGSSSRVMTSVANDTYQVVGTVTATDAREVTNAGLFDASSDGNLFVHGDFAPINLSTDDSITFTIKVAYS